jgi:NAD(P)-dependent dehydrogenase (short-subunit alcohol dehydrogenase family)
LITTQVCKWKELIVSESEAAKISNTSSVRAFIDELSAAYGEIDHLAGDAVQKF